MTNPKDDRTKAKLKALREVVRYVENVHDWCETPLYNCAPGHYHQHYCADRDDDKWCEGCLMYEKAVEALKR